MKNFEDYSNQENLLYSSDKNYGKNLKKCYEYNKLACKIYPKQKRAVYDFLIVYAKTHGLEDERKEFQYFSERFYPKN